MERKIVAICDEDHAAGLIGLLNGSVLVWDISGSMDIAKGCIGTYFQHYVYEPMKEFSVVDDAFCMFHISTYRAGPGEMESILSKLPYDQVVICCNNPDQMAQYCFAKQLITLEQVHEYADNQGYF